MVRRQVEDAAGSVLDVCGGDLLESLRFVFAYLIGSAAPPVSRVVAIGILGFSHVDPSSFHLPFRWFHSDDLPRSIQFFRV